MDKAFTLKALGPGLITRTHVKKQYVVVYIHNTSSEDTETGGFPGLADQSVLIGELQATDRPCLKGDR